MRPLALVTAGSKRIGAHIAARLAHQGHDLAIHIRSDDRFDPVLANALAATGAAHAVFRADLADPAAVAPLWDAVVRHFGRSPVVLVNNASLFGQDEVATATPESLVTHHAVNCLAPVLLAQALARGLPGDRCGAIVNILDQRIASPNGDQFSYTLSKLGLQGATRLLARTLAPRVRVNAVAPGLTLPTADYTVAQMQALDGSMPLGLLPTPSMIADAVGFLVAAEAITDQILYVDGGAHMRHYERDFMHMAR